MTYISEMGEVSSDGKMGEGTTVWIVGRISQRRSCDVEGSENGWFNMSSVEGLQARVVGSSGEDAPSDEDWVGIEGEDKDVDLTNEF